MEAPVYNEDDLDKYPHVAGHRGVETSIEAAEEVTQHIGRMQKMAFEAIQQRGADGLTGDEVATQNGLDPVQMRARISELRRMGRVFDSGQRRRLLSGKRGIVWITRAHLQEAEARSLAHGRESRDERP
jgi:hypothetical protein